VRVWDLDQPEATPITISGHTGPLSAVAFRRDGQYLASAGADQSVRLWRLDPGGVKEAQNFKGHRDWVTALAFSKDGHFVASACVDKLVKLWEVTSKELPLESEHTGSVEAVAVSPDGKLVASGATDRSVKLWNPETGAEVRTLHGHGKAVIALAFSPDGKTLVSGGEDRNLRLWEVATGKQLPFTEEHKLNLENLINSCPLARVSPDGKRLLLWVLGNDRYTTLAGFDLQTGKELFSVNDSGRNGAAAAFSGNGKRAAIGARDGSVKIYDLEPKKPEAGDSWFVMPKGVAVTSVGISPGGELLAAGGEGGEVRICDAAKQTVRHSIKGHARRVGSCAVSPDGKRVATAGDDGVVKLWDGATGKELRAWDLRQSVQERGGFVAQLAFTPDGRRLLTANANTTLYALELP
jgi:WD40 repeat protein